MRQLIGTVVVGLTFCLVQFGQVDEEAVRVSPVALSKIVGIVLRAEFKPREEPTLIYVRGDILREASLPEIANVQFVLIDDAELERLGKAYVFKDPVVVDGKVRVDLGYGDNCEAKGSSYFFRVKDDSVTKTKDQGGWGSGCLSGSSTSKQN